MVTVCGYLTQRARVCVRVCVRDCVRACVHVCVRVHVCRFSADIDQEGGIAGVWHDPDELHEVLSVKKALISSVISKLKFACSSVNGNRGHDGEQTPTNPALFRIL